MRDALADKLLERSPECHRFFERFDADAHFVAVLNPVIDVEAVHRGANEPPQNGAALSFSCSPVTSPLAAVVKFVTRGRRRPLKVKAFAKAAGILRGLSRVPR